MTREEAINLLMSANVWNDEERKAWETLVPELAESEDERIRRMCISAVNIAASADGGLLHSEASECLSWLEEQKDKNCLACDQHLKGYLAGRKVTEEEKQKESLHISETCKENANSFIDGIIEVRSFQRGMEEGRRLEKQKEQKPVDLSDMMVHKEPYIAPVPTPMVADEQKPAEWSEEDEKYLNRVINLWVNDFGEDSDTVKWLKSLRPSWKPSEEQMKALLNTLHPDDPYYHDLKSLYEQLKKL